MEPETHPRIICIGEGGEKKVKQNLRGLEKL